MFLLPPWMVFHMYLTLHMLVFDRDARGMTPFMLAVSGRAYPAAITVLEAAQKMAKGISSLSFHLYLRDFIGVESVFVCGVPNDLNVKNRNQELIITASVLQCDQRTYD